MTIAIERPTKKSRSAQMREQLGYPIIDKAVFCTQDIEIFHQLLTQKNQYAI